jgi:hypothetical protein
LRLVAPAQRVQDAAVFAGYSLGAEEALGLDHGQVHLALNRTVEARKPGTADAFDQSAVEQEVRSNKLAGRSIVTQAPHIVDGRFGGERNPPAADYLPYHLKLQRDAHQEEIA